MNRHALREATRKAASNGIREVAAKTAVQAVKGKVPADRLRPAEITQFTGQPNVVGQLKVLVESAKQRGVHLEHVLLTGPGGLGKTTIALLLANEMNVPLIVTTAPMLGQEPLTKMLVGIDVPGTMIFVDECHGMSKRTEELLYTALEDGKLDRMTPTGFVRSEIVPFTLIGATTLPGKMSESFRDRFGYVGRMEYYTEEELTTITLRSADILDINLSQGAAESVADRSRGVARVANTHLNRLRDYAMVNGHDEITTEVAEKAFDVFGIDELGLDKVAQEALTLVATRFAGGPVGLDNLAVAIGVDKSTISDDVEPYLVRIGLLVRSPKGRHLTEAGRQHVRDLIKE